MITFPFFSKEALVILGGVFGNKKTMDKIGNYFREKQGYDVFVINYLTRNSIDVSYKKIVDGIAKIDTTKYEKINIFCYIFGGRMLLKYFSEHEMNNIGSIVFDRGPIEEDLAVAARERNGEGTLVMFGGRSLLDFSYMNSFDVPENLRSAKIGIIIETRAIAICYLYRSWIKKMNSSFLPQHIISCYDDYYYVPLNHKQMYNKLDVIGPEIGLFFNNGRFSDNVNRVEEDYLKKF
jgi:hypothetical protein